MSNKFEEIVESIGGLGQKDAIGKLADFLSNNVSFTFTNAPGKRKLIGDIFPAIAGQFVGGYPTQYLFFDFCLAALEGDYTDARLYLENTFYVLKINGNLYRFLSVIVDKEQCKIPEVSKLLTLFALAIEPVSARSHSERLGEGYAKRFAIYKKNVDELRPK